MVCSSGFSSLFWFYSLYLYCVGSVKWLSAALFAAIAGCSVELKEPVQFNLVLVQINANVAMCLLDM